MRRLGFDVAYIAELAPGDTDRNILNKALQEKRVVITEDRDFSDLVFRDALTTFSIVLIRIPSSHRAQKARRMTDLVSKHIEELEGAMTTLTLNKIKIRPLPSENE